MPTSTQLSFPAPGFKRTKSQYGGTLRNRRRGRRGPRPLATRDTMHLVLRSTQAQGEWSFKRASNEHKIKAIVNKFSKRYGVRIHSMANVGNHLHFQIKLGYRYTYKPFIRGMTAAIAIAVTGKTRWTKTAASGPLKFWDYRPFTRIVQGYRAFLGLRDYIQINQFEGYGLVRGEARWVIAGLSARAGP